MLLTSIWALAATRGRAANRSGHYAIEVEGALQHVSVPRNSPLQIVAAAVVSLRAALKYGF